MYKREGTHHLSLMLLAKEIAKKISFLYTSNFVITKTDYKRIPLFFNNNKILIIKDIHP